MPHLTLDEFKYVVEVTEPLKRLCELLHVRAMTAKVPEGYQPPV
jgi:hypothetical protein